MKIASYYKKNILYGFPNFFYIFFYTGVEFIWSYEFSQVKFLRVKVLGHIVLILQSDIRDINGPRLLTKLTKLNCYNSYLRRINVGQCNDFTFLHPGTFQLQSASYAPTLFMRRSSTEKVKNVSSTI